MIRKSYYYCFLYFGPQNYLSEGTKSSNLGILFIHSFCKNRLIHSFHFLDKETGPWEVNYLCAHLQSDTNEYGWR